MPETYRDHNKSESEVKRALHHPSPKICNVSSGRNSLGEKRDHQIAKNVGTFFCHGENCSSAAAAATMMVIVTSRLLPPR